MTFIEAKRMMTSKQWARVQTLLKDGYSFHSITDWGLVILLTRAEVEDYHLTIDRNGLVSKR